MQQTHQARRKDNGEPAPGGPAHRRQTTVGVVARAVHVVHEDAVEAPEQWVVRFVGSLHQTVAMSVSHREHEQNWEEAQLKALQLVIDCAIDEGARIRNKLTPPHLTERMRDVLSLVRQQLSSAEIAERLCITRYTVDTHIKRACHILNVSGRHEAVSAALRMGLL